MTFVLEGSFMFSLSLQKDLYKLTKIGWGPISYPFSLQCSKNIDTKLSYVFQAWAQGIIQTR